MPSDAKPFRPTDSVTVGGPPADIEIAQSVLCDREVVVIYDGIGSGFWAPAHFHFILSGTKITCGHLECEGFAERQLAWPQTGPLQYWVAVEGSNDSRVGRVFFRFVQLKLKSDGLRAGFYF